MCIYYSSKLHYREGCYPINKYGQEEIGFSNDVFLLKLFLGVLVYA